MEWLIFMVISWALPLFLVPFIYWKAAWHIGFIGMLIIFVIDSTLISLGAFEFTYNGSTISGLPIPYWISYFPGAILFAYYKPNSHWKRLAYILITSFIFLLIELIMVRLGSFKHINWDAPKAYVLNLGGFTVLLWISEWLEWFNEKKVL